MNSREKAFVKTVWDFFKTNGRNSLPWRKTKDPYKILVSEVMLQQTQVERVIPKYTLFLETFPTVSSLADAKLHQVLRMWQGLGYNRRAKMLHMCAKEVRLKYKGKFPKEERKLKALPGIGPYTASAIVAFAYNLPTSMLETNIRSVFLHHFFKEDYDVNDKELLPYIERTLDTKNPREWFYALMDYGAYIKKTYGNPNYRSQQYVVQSKFEGSDRQIRGAILRGLSGGDFSRKKLHMFLSTYDELRVDAQLEKLEEEGLIEKSGNVYQLAS